MMVVLENKWNVREHRVRYFAVTSRRLVTAVTAPWRETSSDVSLAMLHVGILIRRSQRYGVSWNKGHQPEPRIHLHSPVRRRLSSQRNIVYHWLEKKRCDREDFLNRCIGI